MTLQASAVLIVAALLLSACATAETASGPPARRVAEAAGVVTGYALEGSATPAFRSALRSTRATSRSPSRNGST